MEKVWAIIDPASHKVTNVIVAEPNFISAYCPGAIRVDVLNPQPGIGWEYDGEHFIAPPPPE